MRWAASSTSGAGGYSIRRGSGGGMGRPEGGLADHWARAQHDQPWTEGPRRRAPAEGPGATQGRRPGGAPRHWCSQDATRVEDLRRIVEPATLGCPVRPLLWVSKSHDKLAVALQKLGHKISANRVRRLLPS